MDGDVVVPVRSLLFVAEAEGVEELVGNHLDNDNDNVIPISAAIG